MTCAVITIFLIGYLGIAFESVLKVNKAALALLMSVVSWSVLVIGAIDETGMSFLQHLADTMQTVLFLMGSMTIVEVLDTNGCFHFITRKMQSRSSRILLLKTVGLTFALSSVLDDMTTCMLMVMVLRKLVADTSQRWLLASMVILAANSGGCFSPIGDVTTIMLWIHGSVSTIGLMKSLILPALTFVILPTLLVLPVVKPAVCRMTEEVEMRHSAGEAMPASYRIVLLVVGIAGLLSVPLFRSVTGLPPFVGVMGVLSIVWIVTEVSFVYVPQSLSRDYDEVRLSNVIKKIDMPTLMFFLGVLLAVGALEETGILAHLGTWLRESLSSVYYVDMIIGMLSAVIDNVPLVASAMSMYPVETATVADSLQPYAQDGTFWQLLAYCAGTGGSLLVIGSASGVVVMGLEGVTFGWYLRHISWRVLIGYLAGIAVYWAMHPLIPSGT